MRLSESLNGIGEANPITELLDWYPRLYFFWISASNGFRDDVILFRIALTLGKRYGYDDSFFFRSNYYSEYLGYHDEGEEEFILSLDTTEGICIAEGKPLLLKVEIAECGLFWVNS